MNTPTHLILGAAAFAKPGQIKITIAALLGAFLPDLSLYVMAGWHLLILGTSPHIVFRELYYSDTWQTIFAVDNSFILWGLLLGVAVAVRHRWLVAFAAAGFLHILFDFPLHNDDARQHFWPLSTWVFESPVSYWDSRHHGDIVRPLEIGVSLLLLAVLWRRFRALVPRLIILATTVVQLSPVLFWALVFGR